MSFSKALNRLRLPSLEDFQERIKLWFEHNASTWAISAIVHVAVLLLLMLVLKSVISRPLPAPAEIESVAEESADNRPFVLGENKQYEPTRLDNHTIQQFENLPIAQAGFKIDESPIPVPGGSGFENGKSGSGSGDLSFSAPGLSPLLKGIGSETGWGQSSKFGADGKGGDFGSRGRGHRETIIGVTAASERAVAAALDWLKRHQVDGHWTMDHGVRSRCKDKTCTGTALIESDTAATALGLLPFLAAGQTHQAGFYKDQVGKGVLWLVKHQGVSGDLTSGGNHQMYAHGLATIALCEAYGMTQDSQLRDPAQNAVKFIESAMNPSGGWRYTAGSSDSDLSVFGWELMSLKSAQMAGLQVNPVTLDKARSYLRTTDTGRGGFSYMPGGGTKNSMTAIGVLASQYLGAKKDDPVIRDGVKFLADQLPIKQEYNTYYWYYATQAMHNVPGPEWEKWNRAMRRLLIDSQTNSGCAIGSWNPDPDSWGAQGGRLMVTSLSCLTLEVYYRYTPLFALDSNEKPTELPADK